MNAKISNTDAFKYIAYKPRLHGHFLVNVIEIIPIEDFGSTVYMGNDLIRSLICSEF